MKMSLHCASIRLASLINFPNPASTLRPLADTFRVRAIRESRIYRSVPVSLPNGFAALAELDQNHWINRSVPVLAIG
jgi:hypothetical protein